jgi:hypothetical protein
MIQGPNPEVIAPVVVSIAFFVSTAAVLIFRPLTKRIGDRIAASKQPPLPPAPRADSAELVELRQALEDTGARLERLEQRLDFTERLLSGPRAAGARAGGSALPPPAPGA